MTDKPKIALINLKNDNDTHYQLILLLVTFSFGLLQYHELYAEIQFSRQEISTGIKDGIQIGGPSNIQTKADYNNTLDLSTDIQKVTFFSNGSTFDSTLWLGDTVKIDPSKFGVIVIVYGALFDIDNNPTTGKFGVDFQHEIQWNNFSKKWNNFIIERSSKEHYRLIYKEENYSKIENNTKFVSLSQDLQTLTLPQKYRVLYYSTIIYNNSKTVVDLTSWIDIPPPSYTFSTIPDPIVLRKGEQKDIGIQLKSDNGNIANVINYLSLNNSSSVQVISNPNKVNISSLDSTPYPFRVIIPSNAQIGEYSIPILANLSTGSIFPSGFIEVPNFNISISGQSFSTVNSNLIISVIEPQNIDERIKEFWSIYGAIISLGTAGFVGALSTYLLDRLRSRNKKQ